MILPALHYAWTEFVDMLDVPPSTYWAVIELSKEAKAKKRQR